MARSFIAGLFITAFLSPNASASQCPQLAGYYFYVTPTGRLGGTTIQQRLVGNVPEFTFTDQAANGVPEDRHDIFLVDGKAHSYLDGTATASCEGQTLSIRLSYMIPEGDLAPASFEGTKTYKVETRDGVPYLSVKISGGAKILAVANPTPIHTEFFARRLR